MFDSSYDREQGAFGVGLQNLTTFYHRINRIKRRLEEGVIRSLHVEETANWLRAIRGFSFSD